MHKYPSVSLVIATYNWPAALELCLRSAMRQLRLPDEILVADDGSRQETAERIRSLQAEFHIPLRHIWQEDTGFRLAQIRNKANAAAAGDYIIQVDGDLILHPAFVRDHLRAARQGHFIGGSRVMLDQEASRRHLEQMQTSVGLLEPGISNRMNGLHLPKLSHALASLISPRSLRSIRGCNMAYWRADFIRVNGYDERFEGWGREDTDLVQRFYKAGLQRRFFKWQGIVYHLFHQEADRSHLHLNEALLAGENTDFRCQKGIDQYLSDQF